MISHRKALHSYVLYPWSPWKSQCLFLSRLFVGANIFRGHHTTSPKHFRAYTASRYAKYIIWCRLVRLYLDPPWTVSKYPLVWFVSFASSFWLVRSSWSVVSFWSLMTHVTFRGWSIFIFFSFYLGLSVAEDVLHGGVWIFRQIFIEVKPRWALFWMQYLSSLSCSAL